MKSFTIAGLLASTALAFPYRMDEIVKPLHENADFQRFKAERIKARAEGREFSGLGARGTDPPQGAGALPLVPPPFDAELQYISNQGDHAFVAPGPDDDRGECPGLNAMANHNYLPHNGRATISQFIQATGDVFGMAPDLGTFLAVFGSVVDGNLLGWSIGGKPHTGILGSHGNYEADSSPLKSDLSQYGTNGDLIMSQFYSLYNRQPDAATANYNLEVLRDFRKERFHESIAKNPMFTYNVFSGLQVSQAAFTFIYRFMSNKSAEYPEGILNKATLKSFMAIEGDDEDALYWNKGHEKIPDNWYKRHPLDEYSIPGFQLDVLYFVEGVPEILDLGCNINGVNSYNQISPALLTNGAYDADQIAANPVCFASEFAQAEIGPLLGIDLTTPLIGPLLAQLRNATAAMDCPSIGSINQTAFAICPGFSLYGGPDADVAPGAVRDQ